MRSPLAVAVVLSCCSLVNAIGYSDFPASLQSILDQRIADLQAQGGICIAGRVTFSDGAAVTDGRDVMVNFNNNVDEPLRVYPDGWFIMAGTMSASYAGAGRHIALRSFKYDPLDPSVVVLSGAMTYFSFQMNRAPQANLANITGTVTDEKGQPFGGARVLLDFPFSYLACGSRPTQQVTTSSNGQFSFNGLSISSYAVEASAAEYAYHYATFTPPVGGTTVQNRKLYPLRRVIIDYVYQPDDTLSFSGPNLQTGFIDWLVQEGGVDFAEGVVKYSSVNPEDLELRQNQDSTLFDIFYVNSYNGFYDAGAVPFSSIVQANASGYSNGSKPCVVGHVYVVRTYVERRYAKFVVKSNERWFESVLPGDPEPIMFAGYGLTIDLADVNGDGKLYVQMHPLPPPGIHATLPHYLVLSGMTYRFFLADLQLHYGDDEVAALGLSEDTLSILASSDEGATWQILPTTRDPVNNLLQVHDHPSLEWLAIGDTRDSDADGVIDPFDDCPGTPTGLPIDAVGCLIPVPGDFDGDRDVDQEDFGHFQICMKTGIEPQNDPACAQALLNGDPIVDESDVLMFLKCMKGANVLVDPECAN